VKPKVKNKQYLLVKKL